MPKPTAPILVFDVNETLLDITTLEPLFERLFGDPASLREWFAQLILYSQTMTLCGLYTQFGGLGLGALRMVAETHGRHIDEGDAEELKRRMATMPAHPDVAPALTRLHDAGFRLLTLTNSAPAGSPSALELAGIGKFFEAGFSVDAVRRFKPAPETYLQVAEALEVPPADLCLVACHLWDTIGAQAAGLQGAFVTRPMNALLTAAEIPVPDFIAPDMEQLADQLIARRP
ncbi:haloacid dehalogenase type II [Tropicimonas sp. TH_r6]|uniref:haloacid dehalogenase type II n=1 Tax=Tropicimonas sp. TH_r6 TaxID=3082085 RepID=UPI0029550C9E|nr:haloacid dehalogenase type II [Tropicimonas sp. TH_r6]MDV7143944.1 haloacid dehalogenase type II [Tropicimonas sp. TH_r6]